LVTVTVCGELEPYVGTVLNTSVAGEGDAIGDSTPAGSPTVRLPVPGAYATFTVVVPDPTAVTTPVELAVTTVVSVGV
jgi:hypothetical protein